jgi:hypothetical protein
MNASDDASGEMTFQSKRSETIGEECESRPGLSKLRLIREVEMADARVMASEHAEARNLCVVRVDIGARVVAGRSWDIARNGHSELRFCGCCESRVGRSGIVRTASSSAN